MPEKSSRPARRTDAAVRAIEDLILEEGLTRGDPLPTEGELGERLGMSRSSVREAVKILASLDIVDVRHGHGSFVGELSLAPLVNGLMFRARLDRKDGLRSLREIVTVRRGLDLSLADDLAEVYRGTDNPHLRAHVERMRELEGTGESIAAPDSAFHRELIAPLDNRLVQQLVQAFWEVHTHALPVLGIGTARGVRRTIEAHEAMIDALEDGDAARFQQAVREHYTPLEEALDAAVG
ncbi:FadR family transcriptional regulator [Brachybacterium sp. EF45031]|uniref:FadR/GntR family transcriptional regulator n=1 Tax=Brachybacterium sillae TaxID=2810536 RepID=UPI00217DC361|nr:FCD domain-containing protein [Brachybacterium sillae]MCS6711388.1 FadR family transcriptional regulator [Brachybacterium sillae]